MVVINFSRREINLKLVYYGPGLAGKTTNLSWIHERAPGVKRELVSIATEGDRTLFFDYAPREAFKVGELPTKFQLYTVPGEVYYNATRKLVLQGANGVVFVADSRAERLQENLDSLENLRDNLREQGLDFDTLPLVFQWNKRDLEGASPRDELEAKLRRPGAPSFEAVATQGEGVLETFDELLRRVVERAREEYALANEPAPPVRRGGDGAFRELSRLNRPLTSACPDLGPCLTTEAMRVPALYPTLEPWLEAGECEELLVLGAGRHGERCPQLQELCAVVHARANPAPVQVTVVDIDALVLDAVRSPLPYDFELLSWRESPAGEAKRRMEERLRRLDQARAAGQARYRLDVLRCDLKDMNYGEALADVIVSTFALMYVLPKDEEGAIALLARVIRAVRPGGRFVIDANAQVAGPLFFYDAAKLAALARRLGELVGSPITVQGVEPGNPELFVFTRGGPRRRSPGKR